MERSLRYGIDFEAGYSVGLFVDQRWMDLTPGLFPGVTVLRHDATVEHASALLLDTLERMAASAPLG